MVLVVLTVAVKAHFAVCAEQMVGRLERGV